MEISFGPKLSTLAVVLLMAVVVAIPQANSFPTSVGITRTNSSVSDPPTLISVVRGADNTVYWNNFTSGTWQGWQSLGGLTGSVPVLCSGSSSIEVLVRGSDNLTLWHKSLNTTTQTWAASWDGLGSVTQDQPACGVLGGTLYIAVRGMDDAIWSNSMSLATSTWSGWSDVGGVATSSPILVSSPAANRLDLIAIGTGNSIWHKAFTGGVWSSSWDSVGGTTPSVPAAISDPTSVHLVVRSSNNALYYNNMTFASGVWLGWTLIGGGVTSNSPVLGMDPSNNLHLLALGDNSAVWHVSKPATGGDWGSTWDTAGGVTDLIPAIAFTGSDLVVVVRGADQGMWSNTLVSSSWNGWTSLGGSTPSAPGASSGGTSTSCTPTVNLRSAANFAVLASSTVTNTGNTIVTGDLGLSPGTSVTGFPPGTVSGTEHINDGAAATAQGDLTTAYNDAQGRTLCSIGVAGDLGGQTITPGLYKSTSSLAVTGALTLDAQGNANAVFIFQMASTLTMNTGSQIVLTNGAQAKNIFWAVGSSATLGTNSDFHGTILALASVTLNTGATLDGRALASTGAVTLDTNTVTLPT